jgi:repressor LexA
MHKLTARQEQVLDVIRSHIDETGYPPTRADIARQLGFRSANAAEEHLKALARKGAIEIIPGASRGIRLPVANDDSGLPLVGRVAAGQPILAAENIEEHCAVDPALFHPRADYLLRVHGDSMINAGICDGDLLAVHRTPVAENGAIVIARLGDEVTVKRLKKASKNSELQLIPENDSMSPIAVGSDVEFALEGVSVGVIRRL